MNLLLERDSRTFLVLDPSNCKKIWTIYPNIAQKNVSVLADSFGGVVLFPGEDSYGHLLAYLSS